MENLPDSLYIDYAASGASSSNAAAAAAFPQPQYSMRNLPDSLYIDYAARGASSSNAPAAAAFPQPQNSVENLPDSLYIDYTASGASGSNAGAAFPQPPYSGPPDGAQFFTAVELADIEHLIFFLNCPLTRTRAIVQLNSVYKVLKDRKGPQLGLLLWNSQGIMYSLLQELLSVYSLLSPPLLSMPESTKISHALLLFQCMATHPEARMGLIKAQIPTYFYPFLNTTKQSQPFDSLRTSCLGVIVAMQEEGPNAAEIVRYLLKIETVPLCLRCMDVGGNMTKSLAARVLFKILEQHEGMIYCGSYIERLFAVLETLSKMVGAFNGKPPSLLLTHILLCYRTLSKSSRCCDTLWVHYPRRLKNPIYLNLICDDQSTRALADEVLYNLMARKQVAVVPQENLFARNRV